MKLLINPRGGMAGDMFAAALVSAGADFDAMREAMVAAGEKLGSVVIELNRTSDGSSQLMIRLNSKRHHLSGNEGRGILLELFHQFDIRKTYRDFGLRILEILIKAEQRAHQEFNIRIEPDHVHDDHDLQDHCHDHHDHHHHHHENKQADGFLHEAQDIVIDIMGAVTGMQNLDIEPSVELVQPISVGGGHVHCSHGVLNIPAPATSVILEEYGLKWNKGPIDKELLTPTGAAILAALGSKLNSSIDIDSLEIVASGKSRGTKILDIPPLELLLCR
ncbi:MAG: nickel insertion protein [Candidatus Omnitrophota bacterium]